MKPPERDIYMQIYKLQQISSSFCLSFLRTWKLANFFSLNFIHYVVFIFWLVFNPRDKRQSGELDLDSCENVGYKHINPPWCRLRGVCGTGSRLRRSGSWLWSWTVAQWAGDGMRETSVRRCVQWLRQTFPSTLHYSHTAAVNMWKTKRSINMTHLLSLHC